MQTQMISSLRCDQIFMIESIVPPFFFFSYFWFLTRKAPKSGVQKTLHEVQGPSKSLSLRLVAEQLEVNGYVTSSVLFKYLRGLVHHMITVYVVL